MLTALAFTVTVTCPPWVKVAEGITVIEYELPQPERTPFVPLVTVTSEAVKPVTDRSNLNVTFCAAGVRNRAGRPPIVTTVSPAAQNDRL